MKKFENIIIASDLDGTFLSSDSKEIPRNIEKIKYFTENGGLFTFATGRVFANLLPAVPNCREYVNCPMVVANGMAIYDAKRDISVREKLFDNESMCEMIDALYDKYPGVCYRGMGSGGMVSFQPENRFVKSALEAFGPSLVKIVEREDMRRLKFYKLTLRDEYEVLKEVEAELETLFAGEFNICFSDPTILEIMPLGVSKAMALIELRDMLSEGGNKKILYTVGDYENDIEMHELADVSVCPANAIDSVKAICDIELCDNDSGVIAELIEMLDSNMI